jgi:hypothetical protein
MPTAFPSPSLSTQVRTSAVNLLANSPLGFTIPLIESFLHCNKLTSVLRTSAIEFCCKRSANVPEAKLKFCRELFHSQLMLREAANLHLGPPAPQLGPSSESSSPQSDCPLPNSVQALTAVGEGDGARAEEGTPFRVLGRSKLVSFGPGADYATVAVQRC